MLCGILGIKQVNRQRLVPGTEWVPDSCEGCSCPRPQALGRWPTPGELGGERLWGLEWQAEGSFLKGFASETISLSLLCGLTSLSCLSSHNWNTLFMGPNAVADAIAQKYSATKSQVFDHVSERPV